MHQAVWDQIGNSYTPQSLDSEGFIHCSTLEQVLIPANERFYGEVGLIVLVIDESKIDALVKYEDCYESGVAFPHIYGPLNTNAVITTIPLVPDEHGAFTLTPVLNALAKS